MCIHMFFENISGLFHIQVKFHAGFAARFL